MRIEEDAIFSAYVGSLIIESKKGKKLPPWLKEKGDERDDKKSEKKGDKKEKKLPPWLKGKKGKKGKKMVKEDMDDPSSGNVMMSSEIDGSGEDGMGSTAEGSKTFTLTSDEVNVIGEALNRFDEEFFVNDDYYSSEDVQKMLSIKDKLCAKFGINVNSQSDHDDQGIGDTEDLEPGEDLESGSDLGTGRYNAGM